MKALEKKINMIDTNMDLRELFESTFGKPIIDVNETIEETMERFFKELLLIGRKVNRNDMT